MKKLLLTLLFIVPICRADVAWQNATYKQCKRILRKSMLGETAEEIIYHFFLACQNKEAILIAQRLHKKGLLQEDTLKRLQNHYQ